MQDADLIEMTADIVVNYVANNEVSVGDVAALISEIHTALAGLGATVQPVAEPEYPPATTIRKSLASPAKIISMIDGKPYSTLTRHLSAHGLTAETYRERYRLPVDYPMTAPDYSARRKEMALAAGLGRKPVAPAVPAAKPARRKLGIAAPDKSGAKQARGGRLTSKPTSSA